MSLNGTGTVDARRKRGRRLACSSARQVQLGNVPGEIADLGDLQGQQADFVRRLKRASRPFALAQIAPQERAAGIGTLAASAASFCSGLKAPPPSKGLLIRSIEIYGPQWDLYEAIRMSMEKKVREAIAKQGLGKSHIVLLDALLKLRQICCDPRLLSLPEAKMAHGVSSKLEALLELLDNLVEEGRRVLVFSQFTSMLELIEQEIINRQYTYLKLTGQTKNRHALVDAFQQGSKSIFLISLKAGGTGLNLTRADTVIHYDPWWNPAVEDQATDRTHRIGQENPVFVYKLITAGTVEEAILSMQERKRQLVDGILAQDPAKSVTLTEADIEQFFSPL